MTGASIDPLAAFVRRFVQPACTVYAADNSLGRLSTDVERAIRTAVEKWGSQGVTGWDDWLERGIAVGDIVGQLIGAAPGQVVIGDSTTVQLYKLCSAALDVRPDRRSIVIGAHEFPTDRYVIDALAAQRGLRVAREIDDDTALVCRSLVDFRTAAIADLSAVTHAAHAAGALMVWDLSHAVGVLPVDLDAAGADLAVGCTYKYLCAGPGAPAFAYVRRDLQLELRQPIAGWFGQHDQFAMGPVYEPRTDIGRFQAGTPPIIALAAVEAAATLALEAGLDAIRAKSMAITELFISEAGDALELASPVDPTCRGGHVALRAHDAVVAERHRVALAKADVVVDVRDDLLRFGFAPLATRYEDASAAGVAVRGIA